ncbi:chitinase C-terminal domain-containing protein [Nonomuraea sp. NPDC052265]|uniref:chitinase C-terminal domain-containing protein n=1 Tax=Nonomuraea sp. NPDC052265 TaxID=3364374 RepID=UPI0037C64F8C
MKKVSWQSLAPGASVTLDYVYYLPVPGQANYTLTFGGRTYGLVQDLARGGVTPSPSPTPTVSPTVTPTGGACTAPAWSATAVYTGGQRVSHKAHTWEAKWWTQGQEPGTTGEWGVWKDVGAC